MLCRHLARAFLEIQDHAPPIGSTSHKGGSHGGYVNVDISDTGVGIITLGLRVHESHHFAGFYDREHFADGLYDWSSSDGSPRRCMIGKMKCCPGSQLTIVWQRREGFE